MTFTNILLIIVLLSIAAIGVVYYLQSKSTREINELTARKEELMNVSISDQLFTLKNMDLSGKTKKQYESLQASWQSLTNFKIVEIEETLVLARQLTEQMNVFKIKKLLEEARELLEETEVEVDKISHDLTVLLNVSDDNDDQHKDLLERYNEVRKKVMNQSFDYGPAIETLEKNLQNLELNFTHYYDLTTEGDYIEAGEMLDKIEAELSVLEDVLEKIPHMYDKIRNEYEDSIDDLRDGYKRMLESDYKFESKDIPDQIDAVSKVLDEAKQKIKNANLADAQTLMDKAEREIDGLYDYMEGEVESRTYVNNNLKRLESRLQEVRENNRYSRVEVDRISQSYILHNNEMEYIEELAGQLDKLDYRIDQNASAVKSNNVIFSEAESDMKKMFNELDDINTKQANIVKSFSDLSQRERTAKSNLDLYELELRNLKRRLEKNHLPGLPDQYYTKFYQVSDEIEHLSHRLNRVRIDMDEIEQLDAKLVEDLGQLEEMTDEIIDNATLTEYMIQHGNRFRAENPNMEKAINQAEFLFYKDYRYAEALRVIERELREVDPNASSAVRRMYFDEKEKRTY